METSEEHFNIDEYSDVTQVSKPTILISPFDIHYTHMVCPFPCKSQAGYSWYPQLLSANLDGVAPEQDDPLRVILQDLGPIALPTEVLSEDGSCRTS